MDVKRTEAAQDCARVAGGSGATFQQIQDDSSLEGRSVWRCVFAAALSSLNGLEVVQKESLEINNFAPSAHFEQCAPR